MPILKSCIFVGLSGYGKSTTLRMVAGLEDVYDGELLIDFVADFISSPSMNFLTANVLEKDGSVILNEGSFEVRPVAAHERYLKKYARKEDF